MTMMNCRKCGQSLKNPDLPCPNCEKIAADYDALNKSAEPKPGQIVRTRWFLCGRCRARVVRGQTECRVCHVRINPPVPAHPQDYLMPPIDVQERIKRRSPSYRCPDCKAGLSPGQTICPQCRKTLCRKVPPDIWWVEYVKKTDLPPPPRAPVVINNYFTEDGRPIMPVSQSSADVFSIFVIIAFVALILAAAAVIIPAL